MNVSILKIVALVFVLGCLGGLVNWGFFSLPPRRGESKFGWSYRTKGCETRFPGLVSQVLLGGIGAAIFWCLYGPYAGVALIGDGTNPQAATFTIGQVPISFLIGMGGGGYILNESKRRCAQSLIGATAILPGTEQPEQEQSP